MGERKNWQVFHHHSSSNVQHQFILPPPPLTHLFYPILRISHTGQKEKMNPLNTEQWQQVKHRHEEKAFQKQQQKITKQHKPVLPDAERVYLAANCGVFRFTAPTLTLIHLSSHIIFFLNFLVSKGSVAEEFWANLISERAFFLFFFDCLIPVEFMSYFPLLFNFLYLLKIFLLSESDLPETREVMLGGEKKFKFKHRRKKNLWHGKR